MEIIKEGKNIPTFHLLNSSKISKFAPIAVFCLTCLYATLTFSGDDEEFIYPETCVYSIASMEFSKRVNGPCIQEENECIAYRQTQLGEKEKEAQGYCWYRPLAIDPEYLGSCPDYMADLEADTIDGEQGLLARLYMRRQFKKYEVVGESPKQADTYRERESLEIIKRMIDQYPSNFDVIIVYHENAYNKRSMVENFTTILDRFELEPDCPYSHSTLSYRSLFYLREFTENWLSGRGEGSELSEAELRELISRVRGMVQNSYKELMSKDDPKEYLYWAAASLEDEILHPKDFEHMIQTYIKLDIDFESYVPNRKQALVNTLMFEYGIDSSRDRSSSLRMICNGYSFRIGMLEHCAELLKLYAKHDVAILDFPATDWLHAALLLVDALTRDCTEHTDGGGYYPAWGFETLCFPKSHHSFKSDIESLLSEFLFIGEEPQAQLLLAYLALDETSDDYFLRALEISDFAVVFAARLAKRLLKRGEIEGASSIALSIDPEKIQQLEEEERSLLELTTNSIIKNKTYHNWHERFLDMF